MVLSLQLSDVLPQRAGGLEEQDVDWIDHMLKMKGKLAEREREAAAKAEKALKDKMPTVDENGKPTVPSNVDELLNEPTFSDDQSIFADDV